MHVEKGYFVLIDSQDRAKQIELCRDTRFDKVFSTNISLVVGLRLSSGTLNSNDTARHSDVLARFIRALNHGGCKQLAYFLFVFLAHLLDNRTHFSRSPGAERLKGVPEDPCLIVFLNWAL